MHPNVRRDEPGRCPKCGMALERAKSGVVSSRLTIVAACAFLAIAAFFLWEEHRAHVLGALPYVLLLLCPILHLLMHRGHRRGSSDHHGHGQHRQSEGGVS